MKGMDIYICLNVKGPLISESCRLFIKNEEFYVLPQVIESEVNLGMSWAAVVAP